MSSLHRYHTCKDETKPSGDVYCREDGYWLFEGGHPIKFCPYCGEELKKLDTEEHA